MSRQRRIVGEIDRLNPSLKDTVDQMLLSGTSYREICSYLAQNDVKLSQASVCRYAKRFLATAQQIKIAQENFLMLMAASEKYPKIDTSEAILLLASQKLYDALGTLEPENFEGIPADKIIRESTALARTVAYKKGMDTKAKSEEELAFETNKTLLFETVRKSNPELYSKLQAEILKLKEKERQ